MEPQPASEKDSERVELVEAIASEAVARVMKPVALPPEFTPRQRILGLDHAAFDRPYSQPRGPVI